MKIWVIIDGERRGPMPDYEIRAMISRGELTGDALCWHEGVDGWKRLDSLSIFEREFQDRREEAVMAERAVEPPALPVTRRGGAGSGFSIRRFWARWLDLHLYAGLWWLGLYLARADINGILHQSWIVLFVYLPWVPLEGWLISRFGTTPGKWLLGLRVRNDDGSRLSGKQSVIRAMRVYFLGIGMGWSLVALICQAISFFHVRSTGKTIWDLHAGHHVEGQPLGYWRVPSYVFALILATQMQWIVIAPHVLEDMQEKMPMMRELIRENPPFHLPKR